MTKDYIKDQEHLSINLSQDRRNEIIRELSMILTSLILGLRKFKPDDRSDLDRRFAIAITDAEKLDAYISQYILQSIARND